MSAVAKIKDEPKHVAPLNESAAMFSMIERIMSDPSLPVERVSQAFDFYQRVQADQAQKSWMAAFVAAQAEMLPVRTNADNPQTKSKYATFEALDGALRPIYSKHGFAPTFNSEPSDKPDHVRVVMDLIHTDGHSRRYQADMPADGKGAKGNDVMTKTHATGSAFTYGKRYVLGNAFNVAISSKDDDGNGAGGDAPITDEQVAELTKLIEETGSDYNKFLAIGKVESLSDIMQSKFEKAKAVLLQKGKAAKK
jgi:hypothetical protein